MLGPDMQDRSKVLKKLRVKLEKPETRRRIGRPPVKPSIDDPVAVDRLCRYLAEGRTMTQACKMPDAPARSEVYAKMATCPSLESKIARAREAQQDAWVDRMLDIALAATPETWQVARLQIWAMQWTAGKIAARKYGEKLETTIRGDAEYPVIIEHQAALRQELIRRLDAMAIPVPLLIEQSFPSPDPVGSKPSK